MHLYRFLGFLEDPRNQIDGLPLQLFAEVLVPPQFAALVPGQEADDVVFDATPGQG